MRVYIAFELLTEGKLRLGLLESDTRELVNDISKELLFSSVRWYRSDCFL
jgi:hypothetical protein